MGYRSEVALAIDSRFLKNELKLLKTKDLQTYNKVEDLLKEGFQNEIKKQKFYYWGYIRWYDSFSEILFIEKLIRQYPEKIRFMRIGENYEDTEDRGFLEDLFDLSIERKIYFQEKILFRKKLND